MKDMETAAENIEFMKRDEHMRDAHPGHSGHEIKYIKHGSFKSLPGVIKIKDQIINIDHVVCINLIEDAAEIEIIFDNNGSTLHHFNSEIAARMEFERLMSRIYS